MKKRLLSILLTVCMVLSLLPTMALGASTAWDGSADTSWYEADKTAFTLTTAEQLAGLAQLVNGGNNFYTKTVSLGADIVLNDSLSDTARQWTPIGTQGENGFAGVFDGCGHTVSGLYINNSESHQALFGCISAENNTSTVGVLRNLGVVNGSVTCSSYGAGLVGESVGRIANCYSSVTVTVRNDFAAGIVAANSGTGDSGGVFNCYNVGKISASTYAGGIQSTSSGFGNFTDCFGLNTAVSGASANMGTYQNAKGHLVGFSYGIAIAEGDSFDANSSLFGGGTLLDKLNAWVADQESSDYYTWQIADGVNGGYPVQNAPLSTTKYTVTIAINKDGNAWSDSGKSFTLKNTLTGKVVTDLNAVKSGAYRVLDGGADTGATVTVTDANTSVEINYYTVSGKVSDYDGGTNSVSGLTVNLCAAADTAFSAPLCAATTDDSGNYSMIWTPGSYAARVDSAVGLYGAGTANVTVENTAVTNANITLTKIVTQSIAITSTNHKIAYRLGDALDVTNLQITVAMTDETTKVKNVTADMVTGFKSSAATDSLILTITYDGKTATYTISVGKAAYTGEQATAPTFFSRTENSITLKAQSTVHIAVEFAISNSSTVPDTGWQYSTEFTGLRSSTYYYFFARVKETDDHGAGTVASARIRTALEHFPDTLDIASGNITVDKGTTEGTIKVTHGGNTYDDLPAATEITIKGTSSANTITVNTTCGIVLAGVTITPASTSTSNALNLTSGTLTLTLRDDTWNTLAPQAGATWEANESMAALRVPAGTALIINGDTGRLIATGGNAKNGTGGFYASSGAGIGGNGCNGGSWNYADNGGSVTINGGIITATGGAATSAYAGAGAGIGGGGGTYYKENGGNGGSVTINGGFVTATGGESYAYGAGAGIGGGGGAFASNGKTGGTVSITGGYVIARGGVDSSTWAGGRAGPGIGGGGGGHSSTDGLLASGASGMITISGGTVIATGGAKTTDKTSANCGIGTEADTGSILTVTGGSVTAISGDSSAAAIGGAAPTNGKDAVYKTTFTVSGASDKTKISGLAISGYGTNDIYTVDTNKAYFYLPEGSASATYGGKNYKTTVTNDGKAVFTEYTQQTFTATASISGYTYGGTVSTPSVSANPGSGAVTYYYNTTGKNSGGTEWKDMTATKLDAGDYYLYAVIAAADDYLSCTTDAVKFTVAKAEQSTPAVPTVSAATSGSITVTSVIGQMYFCKLADSTAPTSVIPGWTKATGDTMTFSSLSPNRSYHIYTYIPGDTNHNNSAVSAKLTLTTASAKVTAVTPPENVTLTKYYTAGTGVIPDLPGSAKATLEGDGTQYLNISWTSPASYDTVPGHTNTYTWSVSAPTNYTFDTGVVSSGSIAVTNKAATSVTITATTDAEKLSRTYTGSTFTVTDLFSIDSHAGAASYSLSAGSDNGSITAAGVLTVTKAGAFTVQVDTAAKGNYAAGSATATLTINKGTGTGSVTIDNWTYSDAAKTPIPKSDTNGVTSVAYSYEGTGTTAYNASATAPTNAGTYKVTATFAETDLYKECTAAAAFTITKAPVSFAVSGNTHDYDAAAHTATVTQTASETPSVAGKFTVTYQKDAETATADETNVGVYKIIVALTDGNFKFAGQEDTVRSLTLTEKLTISAVAYPDAGSITLPTAGSLTYGAKLSDSALTGGGTGCTYAWKTGTAIPTVTNTGYAVVCTPTDTNYAPFEKTVSITVSKAAPTLTLPTAGAITYGQKLSDSTFTGGSAVAAYNGTANTNVPGAYSWSAGTTAPKVADSNSTQYEVTFTPTDTANYSTATGKITLTVNPKPVTLTWDYTAPFTYDGAAKTVAATVSNKVGEDVFTLIYSDNSKTNADSYTAKVTALGNSNYTLTGGEYISKEWVIQKAPISFAVSDNSYTYDAAAHKATVAQTASETTKIDAGKFAVTYKLLADNIGTVDKTNVGAYDIIVTLSDDNFCFADESDAATRSRKAGTLTIQQNTVTVLWKNTTTVYDGTAKAPVLELVGLKTGDTVKVRLKETKTEAGTYAVTAELVGTNSANYTLTNPNGTFIIQKAPVSFTLSGNSVKKGESVNVIAVPSVNGISAALTYWLNGKQMTSPTDVGSYDIYAAFSDPNYRHAGGTDGAAQKIGVLTIYASNTPAAYTVSFNANGGTGGTASMAAVQTGTVRILPESGFISIGKVFAGWQYGTKTYRPGECFTQPSSNVTLKALWNDKVYSIGGIVQEGDPASNAANVVVTLMLGSRQIGQTVTGADGTYRFADVVPGVYNLVANKNGVTQTILINITDKAVTDQLIVMPAGKLNSVVEVKAGSPAIVVGNLEKAFTEQDKTDAASKTVELRLTAEAKAADSANNAQQEIEKKAGKVDLFLDFSLTKTVDGTASPLDSSPVLLTAVITLPAELQGKDSYTVYRFHGTEVQILTTTANTDGEKIEVSKDKTTLTVYTKNFSAYAIKGVTYSGDSVSNYTLTFAVNGGSAITAVTKTSGAAVDLSAYTPVREGYTFAGWYSDAKLTKAVTSVKLMANTTVYAKWTGAMPFTDVPADSYYYDAVLWALDKGITEGTTATTFNPNGICTRALTVTFLWRAMGSPEPTATSCPFTDVPKDTYYYKAVLWATEKGITKGTSESTFSPNMTVTRGQAMTFLWRTAGNPAASATSPFADVKAGAYYADAVLWAVREGITSGTSATTFAPADGCSRAQIVTFLYRYLSK